MTSPIQTTQGSFLEEMTLDVSTKGCREVTELEKDGQEQTPRDGTLTKLQCVTSLGRERGSYFSSF